MVLRFSIISRYRPSLLCYTRMLRCVKQIHWERHVTNLELYDGLPRVSTKIRARRLRLAGHCLRHAELAVSKLVLWAPTQGHCSRGRPQTTYVDTLCRDSGLRREELRTAMEDQRVWRAIIRCSASTEWILCKTYLPVMVYILCAWNNFCDLFNAFLKKYSNSASNILREAFSGCVALIGTLWKNADC